MGDLRFSLRLLIKDKAFTLVSTAVLAIGIAAVATQWSVVHATLFRGLPFPDPQNLYQLNKLLPDNSPGDRGVPAPDYEEWRTEQKSFEDLAGYINGSTVNVTIGNEAKRYTGTYVTPSYFNVFRIKPAMGRTFTEEENINGAARVCVISHGVWQRDFGGAADILGKTMRMNGRTATVIGVMGRDQAVLNQEEFWIPIYNEFDVKTRGAKVDARNAFSLIVGGRLKDGVSLDVAQVEFNTFAKRLAAAYPDTNKEFTEVQIRAMQDAFFGGVFRGLMVVMMACVIAVLLIACVNVMNMQFARTILRGRELAVRAAMGASPWRVMRQMLGEGLLLSVFGASLGALLASWFIELLWNATTNVPNPLPTWVRFRLDGTSLLIICGCTVLAAVVSTLLPAWLAVRSNLHDHLKDTGRGNTSSRANKLARAFVVVQIALTAMLLIATLFMVRSIHNQFNVDLGYQSRSVLTARMGLFDGDYPKGEDRKKFYERVARELRTQPAFAEVALSDRFRLMFSGPQQVRLDGQVYDKEKEIPTVLKSEVSDNFVQTLGLRMLEGRDFNNDDTDEKQPVAIVNASFVKRFFPKGGAVGSRFRDGRGEENAPWRIIIGIVPDTLMQGPFDRIRDGAGFFTPFSASVSNFMTIVLRPRTPGTDPLNLAPLLRQEMRKLDANLPLYFISTPDRTLAEFLNQQQVVTSLFGAFGGVGVILAAAGLYGVMGFSVNQRKGEFGIRLALGAAQQHIVRLIYGQGGRQVAIGLGVGIFIAAIVLMAFRAGISNFLVRVSLADPVVFLGVSSLIALVAAIACLFPALRASRVDPLTALRAD